LDNERAMNYTGLTELEMQNFYDVMKNLGNDLQLMDPRGQDIGSRIFKEANLFTPSGNGLPLQFNSAHPRDLMTHRESTEQILMVHSTGIIRDRLYNKL